MRRARLLESERDLRATFEQVLDQLPLGVVVIDQGGRIVVANSAVEAIFGRRVERGEAGESFVAWPRLHLDGRPYTPAETPMLRTLRNGEAVRGEEMIVPRRDGTRCWVEASSTPVRDATGATIGAALVYLDITRRREADGVRDAFVGILSHEIQTPITSVYGGAEVLLKHGRLDETQRGLVADIADDAERMRQLVENLLVVARVDRGVLTGEREPLKIDHLLARVIQDEQRRRPSVSCTAAAPPSIPLVVGDEALVAQVLRNLISNAMKYGGGEPVEVIVEHDPDLKSVTIRVCDRGPGIPLADRPHVFELFYRSRVSSSRAAGMGIGLFVARALTEAMGGRITASDREGGGTELAVTLPVLEESGDE